MKCYRFSVFIFLVSNLFIALEVQAFDVSVLGAVTFSTAALDSPSLSGGGGGNPGFNFGGGGTVGFNLYSFLSFETGLFYLRHSLSQLTNYTEKDLTMDQLMIPLALRIFPLPFIITSLGFYYGVSLRNKLEITSPPFPVQVTSPFCFADWGLLASLGLKWPIFPTSYLRVDLLYQWGLSNLEILAQTQKSRNLNLFAGVQFDVW